MEQMHRRFTAEQVKVLFKAYCQGTLDRPAVQETLGIGKARFFALLKQYRHNPEGFCLTYLKNGSGKVTRLGRRGNCE